MVRTAVSRAARRAERLYGAVALALGVLFAVVLPPMQAPDEIAHFVRAFGIAQGECVARPSITIPTSYNSEATTFRPLNADDPEVAQHRLRGDVAASLQSRASTATTESPSMFSIDVYPCVLYAPAALALALSAWLHPGLVAALLLARLATLLACVALLVAGYRLLPFGRPLYVFITLLPMFVTQAASVTADALTNCFAMFAVAFVLQLAMRERDRRLSGAQLTALAALCTGLVLAKLDAVLLLVLVLIPAARFGGRARKYVTIAGFAAVAFGTSFVWSALNRGLAQSVLALQLAGRNVDVAHNMNYLVSRPGDALLIVLNSARVHGSDWITSTAGTFGWLVTALPPWAVGAAIALFGYFAIRVPSRGRLGPRARAVLAVSSLAGIGLVLALIFGYELTRTQLAQPAAAIALGGVQGRYFLPFLLPLGLTVGWARYDDEAAAVTLAVCAGALLSAVGLVTVAQYFYR